MRVHVKSHEFPFNGNAPRYGLLFGLAYVASYMLVAMGIFNVILAVYATWKMLVTASDLRVLEGH